MPGNSILRFLNSYQNPLKGLTAPSRPLLRSFSNSTIASIASNGGIQPSSGSSRHGIATLPVRTNGVRAYPLSTVVIVALIAFLIGSLLRSMLSPADFVYVASDIQDVDVSSVSSGWREIKRLFELKYIVGGWDFQVALIRRH